MSLTTRVLIGLVAGFTLGLTLAGSTSPAVAALLAVMAPVGTIFINLIRMTVMPLVAAMLIASVGSLASAGALGRAGARAAIIAVVMLAITTVVTVLIATPVLARIQIDQTAALALRGPVVSQSTVSSAPAGAPTIGQWFVDLVSPNVVKAAADGVMLPIIVFAVVFGVALAGVAAERREAVLRVTQGVADAMQRLVAGILELAPIGVFALAVPLASKLGLSAAGAVIAYIVLVVALTVVAAVVLLYPVGIVAGAMPPKAFVSFCAPAQAVAFASRSSLAALPAMVESGKSANLPPIVARFVLPLAASVFRIGAAVASKRLRKRCCSTTRRSGGSRSGFAWNASIAAMTSRSKSAAIRSATRRRSPSSKAGGPRARRWRWRRPAGHSWIGSGGSCKCRSPTNRARRAGPSRSR